MDKSFSACIRYTLDCCGRGERKFMEKSFWAWISCTLDCWGREDGGSAAEMESSAIDLIVLLYVSITAAISS